MLGVIIRGLRARCFGLPFLVVPSCPGSKGLVMDRRKRALWSAILAEAAKITWFASFES